MGPERGCPDVLIVPPSSTPPITAGTVDLAIRGQRWLFEMALPLWSREGFDRTSDTFQEGLSFDCRPLPDTPRRLMVQSRQIAVFSLAAMSGDFPGGKDVALAGVSAMMARYQGADGEPGWVFSVGTDGRVLDRRRDLYGHAFVIYALANVLRLEPNPAVEKAIAATLAFLDTSFADALPGSYRDCLPRPDLMRRQNPHMHLFEAFLALYETTRDPGVLARCRAIHDLVMARIMDRNRGSIREIFDDAWVVAPAPGQGKVEPGHLFEWAWLLGRYDELAGTDHSGDVTSLLALAIRAGLDAPRGRIVDEIGEDGSVRMTSSRSWPHTEALKALTANAGREPLHGNLIRPIGERLLTVYCPEYLRGGWIDHVNDHDKPISRFMPASTLYHLYGGFSALGIFSHGISCSTGEKL